MIFEQHLTDMVQVDDLPDGISRLTFAFETTNRAPEAFYAPTAQVQQVVQENPDTPVAALAKIDLRFYPLNPACIESIFTDVPPMVFDERTWRTEGGMEHPFAAADADVPVTPQTLFARDHRTERVISFATGRPVSIATVMGGSSASAEKFDLPVLADLLGKHPWVKTVYYDEGRPGYFDHVAPSISAVVTLPQDLYEQVLAACDDDTQRGTYSGQVSDLLFFLPAYGVTHPVLGSDPLGIAAAVRTTPYRSPQEEWDLGETYQVLAETLPKGQSLYW